MTAEILDGKAIAATIRSELRGRVEKFQKEHGRVPGLHVILVGADPASQVYVRMKERAAAEAGMVGAAHRLPESTTQRELLALVEQLNRDPSVDGILVQLPLPKHLDAAIVTEAVLPAKDVDGLHPHNAGLLLAGQRGLRPCTPLGCIELLDRISYKTTGKRAVVVGRSNLVGKPLALMLLERNATVTMAHSKTPDLPDVVRSADIVMVAVGRAGLVRGDWIKPGAVVVDVGVNRMPDGKLVGDIEFDHASKRASWITPVPGGVGPMTIAMLLRNTVDTAELSSLRSG